MPSTTHIYKAFYLEDRGWECNYQKGKWTHPIFSRRAQWMDLNAAWTKQVALEDRSVECPMCSGMGRGYWSIDKVENVACDGGYPFIVLGCPLCEGATTISPALESAFLMIAPPHYQTGMMHVWDAKGKKVPADQWIPRAVLACTGDRLLYAEDHMLLAIQALARRVGKRICK